MLPEATRRKIDICPRSRSQAALLKVVELAELPDFLGGEQLPERSTMPNAAPMRRM
jgi:hypothetical protein